jgi:hypothetical protein
MYADPQAGLWYPPTFLLSVLVGYNIYIIQVEFVLHLILAGYGIYKLLRTIGVEYTPALAGAAVFPVSGFFVSHASHLTWVISMAWMPFVFNYYLLGLRQLKLFRFIQAGFFWALCLTGGYVVFPVLTCYALGLISLYHLFKERKEKAIVLKTFLYAAVTGITFFLLSSGYIFSLLQSLPYLKRADGLTVEIANINPFSPASFLSFLFPLSTCINTDLFNTDMTMRNLYMGVLLLPLLTVALIHGEREKNLLLLAAGVFCLMAAMGAYLPVRAWLYHALPFMKMFRHTAIFRSFTLISFLLIAVDGLNILFVKPDWRLKRTLSIALSLTAIAVVALFIVAIQKENIRLRFPAFFSVSSMAEFIRSGNIYGSIIVQSAFQGVFLALSFASLFFLKGRKLAWALSLLWVTDVAVAAQLNVAGTVVSEVKAFAFHEQFKKLPHGFPNPGLTPVEHYNQFGGEQLSPVVYNASILRKEPCADGFNAFCLRDYMIFLTSEKAATILKQPLAFYSNKDGEADSLSGNSSIRLSDFKPGFVKVVTSNHSSTHLTLLQAYFPGWNIMLDNAEVKFNITNHTFMTIPLPSGNHTICYSYQPSGFYWFASLQCFSYVVFLLWAVNYYRKQSSTSKNEV